MILTAEEQAEYREEIDYLIEIHGYEYVWGYDTPKEKIVNFIKGAPGKIVAGAESTASNPTLHKINDALKSFADKVNAGDGLGGGGGLGGGSGGMSFLNNPPAILQRPPIMRGDRKHTYRRTKSNILDIDENDHL